MTPASILIVEDEAIVALDLRTQLEELGYDVIGIADQADDALKIAAVQRPDLVLMDVRLKGPTDGIRTAGILTRMYHVPVVYLTAHSDDETVQRAAGTAPYGYLTKPFQIRELRAAIEVALTKARMERQLQDSERWFASTLQCVQDGVILTQLDGRVRFLNPSAELLTGWTNDQAIGQDVRILVRFERTGPDAGGEPVPTDAVHRALLGGEVVGIDHARRMFTRDMRVVAVDQSASPIDDDSGHRLGAVLVLRDATRRLEQESRLRASEERFRNAFDHAPLGMALVAFDGRLLQVNAALCRFLGATPEDLRRRRNEALTWPADREHEQARLRHLLDGQERVVQFEKRYRHADGQTPLWALVSVSLLLEDEQPTCWLYQVHDLTEQKKAAEQVAELAAERMRRQASELADKAKSDFLSRASHEMRTPLNAVLGFAHLLQQDGVAQDPERMKRFARQIATAGEHLLVMVNDVLDLQRAAQGQLRLLISTVSLADAVGEACDLLGSQAQGPRVVLERTVAADLLVRADDTRLRQVLLNIGSNAIKYNRPGGRVGFHASRLPDGRVRLEITDTGSGLSDEQMSRLFQPFDRLGRERSEIPGTGLGLLIARNLVQEMGGRLELHSQAGTGTRVTIDLTAA